MVASIFGAGRRLGLARAVAFGLGMAGTVATSAASDAELETVLLPSRPPEAIDLAYPGRPEQLRQSPWQGLLREEPLDLRVVSVDLEVTYNASTHERTMKHTLTLDGGADRGVVVSLLLKPKRVGHVYAYAQVTAVRAHDATAVHETKVWEPRQGESPPTVPAHGGTHPERNEVVGPYPGVVLTSGVLPAGIGSLHCAPDDSLRR
jgi:hypothetical protein